ncbi:MAG: prepilin-type N-terminal cleavage/methylation domain-containing protein [Gemmatimonadota bacterium]|nr:prepilin-type N-terminal cleavage/methylation domain-containing protein [Gemmatimonadota bacterium]MDH5803914.1 prepilin-type N-terminal cleavage/methylation domain-containing protein [Gemmatimonadota bacterium]
MGSMVGEAAPHHPFCAKERSDGRFFGSGSWAHGTEIYIMKRGFTFVELIVVMAIVGIVAGITVRKIDASLDRIAVRRSVNEARRFFEVARLQAILRGRWVEIAWREDSLVARWSRISDSESLTIPGPKRRSVTLEASRPVIVIQPTGLGSGTANTKLVFRRGRYADSLATSRLGRLRLMR